jgi:hypothetical protein
MRQKPYFDEKPDDSDTLLKYQDDQWYNTESVVQYRKWDGQTYAFVFLSIYVFGI